VQHHERDVRLDAGVHMCPSDERYKQVRRDRMSSGASTSLPQRLGEYARRHHPNRSQASRGRYRAGQGVAGDAATHPGLHHRAFEPEPVHEAIGTRSCHLRRGFI